MTRCYQLKAFSTESICEMAYSFLRPFPSPKAEFFVIYP